MSTLDQRAWKFDAVGRVADWVETSAYGGTTRWDQGETLTFDGEGRTTKRLKRSRMYASPPSGWYEEPEYYVYSSVTGQKMIELDQTGQWRKTNVYMGSTVIAEHTSGGVAFKHTDPVAGSVMQTNPAGEIEPYDVGRVELEPLGALLATRPPEIQSPPHDYRKGAAPSNPEKCEWDGVPFNCDLLGFVAYSQDVVGIGVRIQGHENGPHKSPVDLRGQFQGVQTGIRDENGNWIEKSEIEWFRGYAVKGDPFEKFRSKEKLTPDDCDKKLSSIFGGFARAMEELGDLDPRTGQPTNKDRSLSGHSARPRHDLPKLVKDVRINKKGKVEEYSKRNSERGGIIHVYANSNGTANTGVHVTVPGGWMRVTPYDGLVGGNTGIIFNYANGITIELVHVATDNADMTISRPRNPGPGKLAAVGGIGGPGGAGSTYYHHTHIVFFANKARNLRADPRALFCGY